MVVERVQYKRSNNSGPGGVGPATAYDVDTIPDPVLDVYSPTQYTVYLVSKDPALPSAEEVALHDFLQSVGYTCEYVGQAAVALDDTILDAVADCILISDITDLALGAAFRSNSLPLLVLGDVDSSLVGLEMVSVDGSLQGVATNTVLSVYEGADYEVGNHNDADDTGTEPLTGAVNWHYIDEAGTPGTLAAGAVELLRLADGSNGTVGLVYPKGSTMKNAFVAPAARMYYGIPGAGLSLLGAMAKITILQYIKYGIETNV